MATTDTRLRAVHEAIDEFEEAVKRHEHKRLLESEVVLRQEVDKARQQLVDTVSRLVGEM